MKKTLHLGILLSTALNCVAGWHNAEPFVAWPATNHLRWTTNVGAYTNQSDWHGTNGYGGWTNNYWSTNLWTWEGWPQNGNAPFYWDGYGSYSPVATGMFFNAKDVRVIDCTFAALERWIAARKDTNYFGVVLFDTPSDGAWEMFYRNETRSLFGIKRVVAAMAGDYYRMTTNGPTAWDTTALSVAAGGPSNFLAVTAGMTRGGGRYYPGILTNTWTLTTTNSGITTNTFIDSWGDSHVFSGTNGQAFSAIVTNATIQPGKTMDDYLSWDTLKAAITNLVATRVNYEWTNSAIKWARGGATIGWGGPDFPHEKAAALSNAFASASNLYAASSQSSTNIPPQDGIRIGWHGTLPNSVTVDVVSVTASAYPDLFRTNDIERIVYYAKPTHDPYLETFDRFDRTFMTNGMLYVFSTNSTPDSIGITSPHQFPCANFVGDWPGVDYYDSSKMARGWRYAKDYAYVEWRFEYR